MRRWGLIGDGDEVTVGKFTVRIIEAPHSPGNIAPGFIHDRLCSPCHTLKFKDSGCFVFHFSHPEGNILVVPSANYIPGFLDGLKAQVVYLGIGAFGRQSDAFSNEYWANTVEQLEPELVIPVHWDHFDPLPVQAAAVPGGQRCQVARIPRQTRRRCALPRGLRVGAAHARRAP
ncbi:MBL fold metallo-hydrolase [Corynebacterium senegalense]|uniref:MBL fold metallo-hydrolase n=1 Tax=Corynebacterium senegalense TaxID=2080750 RepID=UPI0015F26E31|nr:hypothetical protein [Corynebacterium senegalense]